MSEARYDYRLCVRAAVAATFKPAEVVSHQNGLGIQSPERSVWMKFMYWT